MTYIIYFLVALFAPALGALTGMGGGVIIKPVLDALGDYDVATINILSSVTVFVMSLVSIIKQVRNKVNLELAMAVPLACGSLCGGIVGDQILKRVIAAFHSDYSVKIIQNSCLILVIAVVFVYMSKGSHRHTLYIRGMTPALLVGVILGTVSAFLGIGGGPINVALIIFVFSFDIKTATVCSIITIFFAQGSKLVSTLLCGTFLAYNLSMLPIMILGAVIGGLIGSRLNQTLSEKTIEKAFNYVQVLVFIICLFNILNNLIS